MTTQQLIEKLEPEQVMAIWRQNLRLKTVLQQHHEWQCTAEGLFMFYQNPETKRLECCDISGEYGDCDLHDITRRALKFQEELEAALRSMDREGA